MDKKFWSENNFEIGINNIKTNVQKISEISKVTNSEFYIIIYPWPETLEYGMWIYDLTTPEFPTLVGTWKGEGKWKEILAILLNIVFKGNLPSFFLDSKPLSKYNLRFFSFLKLILHGVKGKFL